MAITIDGVTYRNLQEQVGKNAEDIYELQGKAAKDEADISQAETKISQAETKISQAETKISQSETKISQAETKISQAETKISQAETNISGINGLLNNVIAGIAPLEKVHVLGESNLEGPVTAGGPMEVDGRLKVNSPNDIGFKEDDSSLKQKLDEKLGSEGGALAGSISGSGMSIDGKNGTIRAQSIQVGTEQEYANIKGGSIYVYSYGIGGDLVFPDKPGQLALLTDLRARFRHSITIKFKQGEIHFTTVSWTNQQAGSFQDLASLFGITEIACSGVIGRLIATLVHIGNSLTDSRVYMITIGSTDDPSSSSATFDELTLLNIYDFVTPL